jgi:hypothetical protein
MTAQKSPHIEQVRQALLDTLADLRNREAPMDIDRAKAVATVAAVLVDTARVENDYLKITGQDSSRFLGTPADNVHTIPRIDGPAAHNPFPGVVRHELRG